MFPIFTVFARLNEFEKKEEKIVTDDYHVVDVVKLIVFIDGGQIRHAYVHFDVNVYYVVNNVVWDGTTRIILFVSKAIRVRYS